MLSALVGFGAVAEMVIIDTKVLFKRQNKLVPTLKNLLLNGHKEMSLVKGR